MGKSNNLDNKFKEVYQRDKDLSNFLEKNNIKMLEDINKMFVSQIKNNFFSLIRENIKLVSYHMKITSNYKDTENIKNFIYSNLIEITPFKNKSLIILSSNFLSVITNILFGSNREFTGNIQDKKDMTSTEYLINKKIIKLIMESYLNACTKFFLIEMNFINVKILIDFKKIDFDNKNPLLIKNFHFIINNTDLFFSIFFSLSTIKKLNSIITASSIQNINVKHTGLTKIFFDDISHVKLEIITKLIDIFIDYNQLDKLSLGYVLLIKKPDKTTSYIGKKAIFYGKYRTFNKRSTVLIKEFIDFNLESHKKLRNTSMSSVEKSSNSKELMHSENKYIEKNYINEESIPIKSKKKTLNNSDILLNNKKIVLDTPVNITVELGKSKIKIKDFLNFSKGSVLMLDKLTEEPLDIFMNDSLIASGEIVVLENKYGLRITSIKKSLKSTNILI